MKVIFDHEEFKRKPTGEEVRGYTGHKGICNRMTIDKAKDYTLDEIGANILKGKTIKAGVCDTKEADWKEQQIFMIDIDDSITIEQAIDKYGYLNPCLIYTTFSHTEEKNKFRMMFKVREVIRDFKVAKNIQLRLMQAIPERDEKCSNLNRLYFGGKELVLIDDSKWLNVDKLPELEGVLEDKNDNNPEYTKKKVNTHKDKGVEVCNLNKNIELIKNLNHKTLRTIVNTNLQSICFSLPYSFKYSSILIEQGNTKPYSTQTIEVANSQQFYDLIYGIDLNNFLGVNYGMFNCIFHNDSNPSANIIIDEKYGTKNNIYNCFGCSFKGGIIKIVENIAQCSKLDAINFIKNVYNIKIVKSKEQIGIEEELRLNVSYLLSGKLGLEYPSLWKFVKPRLSKLISFHEYVINNLIGVCEEYNGLPIYYINYTKLKEIFDTKSNATVRKTINLFCLLGLILKRDVTKMGDMKSIKDEKNYNIKNKNVYKKLTNRYQLQGYSDNILEKSEDCAIMLLNNNFSMTGFNREWVIRTFGIEIADELFPQHKNKTITKKSDERTSEIVKQIFKQIDKKGYAVEKDIIDKLQKKYGKTMIGRQIKTSLQEIIDTYRLSRIRMNKELKEQLKYKKNGYPFVIVKEKQEEK